MSLSRFKRPIAPVGDLEGPYLSDFWAAWEDDVPPAPEKRRPQLVLVTAVVDQRSVPESPATK